VQQSELFDGGPSESLMTLQKVYLHNKKGFVQSAGQVKRGVMRKGEREVGEPQEQTGPSRGE
jgi:hypothetical protein